MAIQSTTIPTTVEALADGVTLDVTSGKLHVKDDGVTADKIDVVGIDGATGKVNQINSTNFEDLDGSNLTDIPTAIFSGGLIATTTPQNGTGWTPINTTLNGSAIQGAEVNANIVVPRSGTLRNFYVRMVTRGHASNIFTISVNGADSDITLTANADNTLFSDLVHTASVTAGDLINIQMGQSDDAGNTTCSWGVELV